MQIVIVSIVAATTLIVAPEGNSSPEQSANQMRTAVHIPWAVGGPRIEADGTLVNHPGEWPDQRVNALRLWDTRTAWLNLEPAQGRWNFAHLDAHLAKARSHGVDHVTLVLWGTPQWAARDTAPTDAPWLGPGSAAPPRDMGDWLNFVATVAHRYRGVIDAYQIGNEPNNRIFWRGSDEELISMVVEAAEQIKAVDPQATVIAPPILVTAERQVQRAIPVWQSLAKRTDAIDAWSLHWYPGAGTKPTDLARVIRRAPHPLWLTEVGLPAHGLNARQQRAQLAATAAVARSQRVAYLAWYAWTNLGPAGLVDMMKPESLKVALE